MKITKFGHCCLLVEEGEVRILTDPGVYSSGQDDLMDIDLVLITHEHQDHLHIDSLKAVLTKNPEANVVTNESVGALLEKEGIAFRIVEDGQSFSEGGVLIEGFGKDHALLAASVPPSRNTGYLIANRLFYPGDAFVNPGKDVGILALPVAGPWMKLPEAIDYALHLKPKVCFPVHEGMLKSPGSAHRIPATVLPEAGIKFTILDAGIEAEL